MTYSTSMMQAQLRIGVGRALEALIPRKPLKSQAFIGLLKKFARFSIAGEDNQ